VALNRLKAKRILVLTNSSDSYSDGLSNHFLQSVKQSNAYAHLEVAQFHYIVDRLNITELKSKIASFSPDLIFLPELKVHAVNIISKLNLDSSSSIRLLGADGWGSETGTLDIFYSGVRHSKNGNYFYTYHWHPEIKSARNQEIKRMLQSYSGSEPYGPAVLTFEALLHLKDIVESAKTFDNSTLAQKLRNSSFEGSTGKVTYKNNGTIRNLVLLELTSTSLKFDSLVPAGAIK
jgi:hypothetical protein